MAARARGAAGRLGALPPGPPLLGHFTHTTVSEPTVRRKTEQAGAAGVAAQTAVAALGRDAPEPPPGPARQQLSADGPMVPLVGQGARAQAKTRALGTVRPPVLEDGRRAVHTAEPTSFSRLADHEASARLALVGTHRRGGPRRRRWRPAAMARGGPKPSSTTTAPARSASSAGGTPPRPWGPWRACFGADTAPAEQWLAAQPRALREGDPDAVLGRLRGRRDDRTRQAGAPASQTTLATGRTGLPHLEPRRARNAASPLRAAGAPVGSGSAASAHAAVV